MNSTVTQSKRRRMARGPQAQDGTAAASLLPRVHERGPSKLDKVEAMLCGESGTTIAEMVTATGWQQHSVRGAMAGALKKRGLVITSNKVDGVRRYRGERTA